MDFLYIDWLTKQQREQLLDIVYVNFNDYPIYKHNPNSLAFIYAVISTLDLLYANLDCHNEFLDFLVRLYLSATSVNKNFIDMYLISTDRVILHTKIARLNEA